MDLYTSSLYFDGSIEKMSKYYYDNYSIRKLLIKSHKYHSMKLVAESYKQQFKNKVSINNIISGTYDSIIKYNYYNAAFYFAKTFENILKTIYGNDLLYKTKCEITTKPFAYEAINNTDVYLTNTNFFNLSFKNYFPATKHQ